MKKFIHSNWKVLSFIVIILLTLIYFYLLVGIRKDWQDNCLNFLSILSSFSSIVGIGIALWQIGKISEDLQNYKIMQILKKQSAAIEKIKNAKKTIIDGIIDYKITVYQIDEIKEIIIKTTPELKASNNRFIKEELDTINNILKEYGNERISKESENIILSILEEILEYLYKLD